MLQEGVADFATIDRILVDAAGFRMGPFTLMDLVGLDVAHAVMKSMHQQYYGEPKYQPAYIAETRRITSYNVCYTKLLRDGLIVDEARMRRNLDMTHGLIVAEAVMMGLVITSYSIHYTKLYEGIIAPWHRPRSQCTRSAGRRPSST